MGKPYSLDLRGRIIGYIEVADRGAGRLSTSV
jgi:hypothetical protein